MPNATTAQAIASVPLNPQCAFALFTKEIGTWRRHDMPFWIDSERGLTYRLEPGVGGRLLETYDQSGRDALEIGRVRVWEPDKRIVLTWRMPYWRRGDDSEVDIRFTSADGGTRVELTHDFTKAGAHVKEAADYSGGWTILLGFYSELAKRQAESGETRAGAST